MSCLVFLDKAVANVPADVIDVVGRGGEDVFRLFQKWIRHLDALIQNLGSICTTKLSDNVCKKKLDSFENLKYTFPLTKRPSFLDQLILKEVGEIDT